MADLKLSFLAEVGGLSVISFAIFDFLLSQCEARFKNLHLEETKLQNIRSHRRAQKHWDKVRKYVRYTWGQSNINMNVKSKSFTTIICGTRSLPKIKQPSPMLQLHQTPNVPFEKDFVAGTATVKSLDVEFIGNTSNFNINHLFKRALNWRRLLLLIESVTNNPSN
ncbi:hypothetical protein HPP92_024954 [Vanilla planifolia]|nr:hypothetical protein HPP92_024954 [Vanilla planifolia]